MPEAKKSPLYDHPRSNRDGDDDKFDPESDGYDYKTARDAGIAPKEGENWPSRDPRTGVLLKGKKHPTFQHAVEVDESMGYKLSKRDDGRYVTEKEDE